MPYFFGEALWHNDPRKSTSFDHVGDFCHIFFLRFSFSDNCNFWSVYYWEVTPPKNTCYALIYDNFYYETHKKILTTAPSASKLSCFSSEILPQTNRLLGTANGLLNQYWGQGEKPSPGKSSLWQHSLHIIRLYQRLYHETNICMSYKKYSKKWRKTPEYLTRQKIFS